MRKEKTIKEITKTQNTAKNINEIIYTLDKYGMYIKLLLTIQT